MRTIRAFALSLFALALPASILLAPASALATALPQGAAKAADPYQGIVSRDGVELRSGPGVFYYPVAALKAGTVLRVVAEDSGFLKVAYPDGLKAFIRAGDEVAPDPSGKSLKLTRPAKILHANMTSGAAGSFCPIAFDKDPEPGAEFKILDTIKGEDGKPRFFAIAAPAGTFGFVNKETVRKLSADEIAAVNRPPAAPKPAAPAPASSPGATTPPAPASTTPAPSAPSAPASPASDQPAPNPSPDPAAPSSTPAMTLTPAEPVKAPEPPKVVDTRKADLEALTATFRRVQSQAQDEAELAPAIAHFNDFIAKLGDNPVDRRLADHLKKYVEVMQLRLDLRDALDGKGAGTITALEQKHVAIDRQLAELEKLAVYRVIGRLLSSTVYDGTRLPKLYRVVSPEPGNGRTLAYVQPKDGLDLEAKLGRTVGVVGDAKLDESLKANLISPRRVDVLSLAALSGSSPTVMPQPQPADKR